MRSEYKMRRALVVLAVTVAAAAVGIAIIATQGGTASGAATSRENGPGPSAQGRTCHPVAGRFDLGTQFKGLAVEHVRQCEPLQNVNFGPHGSPPPSAGVNAELAVYGTCTPEKDSSCAPPLSIQTWDACDRNYAQYAEHPAPDGSVPPHERIRVRGVDGAVFDEGQRVELYGRRVTVVIFASDPALAMEAAKNVRGEVGGRLVQSSDALPAGAPSC
jgi:hypothetical protein